MTKKIKLWLALPCLLLSGCTLVPGMHMKTGDLTPSINAQGDKTTPTITPITAQLILKQEAAEKVAQDNAIAHYKTPKGFTAKTAGYAYRVGPQDVLQITVWNHPDLSNPIGTSTSSTVPSLSAINRTATTGKPQASGVTVDSQGNIFFPYVGTIHVSGLTASAIRTKLTTALSQYIKDPQINVQVIGFNSQKIDITGAVKQPAVIPVTNVPLTVLNAITQAGGPIRCGVTSSTGSSSGSTSLCANISNVEVTHDGVTTQVNLNSLKSVKGSSTNWLLHNGDVLYVPNNNLYRVFILGAVQQPGPYNMTDDKMTLREALGDARGVSNVSDPTYTYIIRNYQNDPQIFELNARSPDALNLAGQFALKPEDVIFISTSKLENFNSIINQFIPSLSTAVYIQSLSR